MTALLGSACLPEGNATKVHQWPHNLLSPNGLVATIESVKNTLFCGDNLEVLRRDIPDKCVDLVYLDPPFNSDQNYNLLFKKKDGALEIAFRDTWQWGKEAQRDYCDVVNVGGKLGKLMELFRELLDESDMLAYLSMMAPRLVELHRVLRPTGSLYLHCDPTASHYLKTLMDSIFGPQNFRNEIVWKRTYAHGGASRWGDVHDIILFYTKSDKYTWNRMLQAHDPSYIEDKYRWSDKRGRYSQIVMTGPGTTRGPSGQPWRGYNPTDAGRHWAVPQRALEVIREEGFEIPTGLHDQLELLYSHDFIYIPKKSNGSDGVPRFKLYLPKGQPIQDIICDIPPINSQARERLGYPTQKPITLLDRIIQASSSRDEVVFDPFCGCGTTIDAARDSQRHWVGIDISIDAVKVIRDERLDVGNGADYRMVYRPTDMRTATVFAAEQPFAFQDWAVEKLGGVTTKRRSGDRGVDGRCYFRESSNGPLRQIIVSVKSGKINPAFVRELQGTVERERAAMGVLITLHEPSKQMLRDAASSLMYGTFPRTQIITTEHLLSGKRLDLPELQSFGHPKGPVSADIPEQRVLFGANQ